MAKTENEFPFQKLLFLLLIVFFLASLPHAFSPIQLTDNFNMDAQVMNAIRHFADSGIVGCDYIPIISGGPVDHQDAQQYKNFPTIPPVN